MPLDKKIQSELLRQRKLAPSLVQEEQLTTDPRLIGEKKEGLACFGKRRY